MWLLQCLQITLGGYYVYSKCVQSVIVTLSENIMERT